MEVSTCSKVDLDLTSICSPFYVHEAQYTFNGSTEESCGWFEFSIPMDRKHQDC